MNHFESQHRIPDSTLGCFVAVTVNQYTLLISVLQVSPEPDIRHVTVDPANDQFMVVACDGVWNSMSVSQVSSNACC